MATLSDPNPKNSKIFARIIVTALSVFWILFCTVYIYNSYNKKPFEYEKSVWTCSEPNVELYFDGDEENCIYHSPDGEIELTVSFGYADEIFIEEKQNESELAEDIPFMGSCVFDSEMFVVRVEKNELFDDDYRELKFVRVK